MIILDHEQGSDEWLVSRLGKITGSNMSKLITSTGKKSTSADGYINQLIAERLTGEITTSYVTPAMERGSELEAKARTWYEFLTDSEVIETGLCLHDEFPDVGISPDGLIQGDNGRFHGLEIKCPEAKTMVSYLRAKKLPSQYVAQVQACIWVTDADWWDFVAYHPKMKPLHIRILRDDEYIAEMAAIVSEAVETINYQVENLRSHDD